MKDRPLKDLILQHFWAQRCFVQPEIDVQPPRGVSESTKLITDVDVLIYRPHADLHFETILADCRTLKGQSPVSRALWLKGLMDFVGARTGLILLRTLTPIESDHKIAANQIGIRLFRENEFKVYDKAIVFPEGSERTPISIRELQALKDIGKRFVRLQPFLTYLYRDALLEHHYGGLIRHLLGQLRSVSGEFDPAKVEHKALVCDAAAIFAIGVAQCTGEVFHQYLQPAEKEVLSESLKVSIWGGREQYDALQALRQKAFEHSAGDQGKPFEPLALPEWNQFLQLIRNTLDKPASAFEVPWILRRFTLDLVRGWEPLKYVRHNDLLTLKFAMLVLSYLCRATNLPKEFEQDLVGVLVSIQSRLANGGSGGHEPRRPVEEKVIEKPVIAGNEELLFPAKDTPDKEKHAQDLFGA